ncbi:CRISPR-associated endonuclease Cas2 [Fusobacterium sp.]|jgi:CRISPR-associated protein Cas2|uniref:CRISPR-associated endonuclease Cas2 n=1 Tax=Fusobacterium sp. TaxID=68766 RepID=UPI001D85E8FC|nr:CRISPR-associated endonuclease Cas2 [Fusobacterium sp.]MBS5791112.1 CRISPR-associated endonuclease Cas2 [Fusobacterium sp.]MEE1476832.1 CRISPR-associated endonuclease Cas2 [Fusobacterium sp.]
MNYILTYDISNNRIRRKVSELLIDRGFVRVQRSVFIGEIFGNKIEKILEEINIQLEIETDSLLCMPINKEEYLRSYKYGYIPNYDFYKQDVIYM